MDYIITSNGELYHYGVKGMKWGKRKWSPVSLNTRGRRFSGDHANSGETKSNDAEKKSARVAKVKRAAKIGAGETSKWITS